MKYPDDYINKVIQGDCLEVMKQMPDKCVDLVLTDPPYGVSIHKQQLGKWAGSRLDKGEWDLNIPSEEYFTEIFRVSKKQIFWGGNYFPLRPSRAFLVWDKGAGFKGRDFAECELAWCSEDMNARIFLHDPLARGDYKNKHHPTTKPVELMKWCLTFFPEAQTVLDPFLGSGTTALACKQLNRNFIGIELSEKYCTIANERLAQDLLFT